AAHPEWAPGPDPPGDRRRADDVREEHAHRPQLVLGFDGRRSLSLSRPGSAGRRHHFDPRCADLDRVTGREKRRARDSLPVHPRSIQRSEVLDLEPFRHHAEDGVGTRDFGIVDDHPCVIPSPDGEAPGDVDPTADLGAVENRYDRRILHYPSTLPSRWCQNLHQPYRPGWSVSPSRAMPRKSVCVSLPDLLWVATMTASLPSK